MGAVPHPHLKWTPELMIQDFELWMEEIQKRIFALPARQDLNCTLSAAMDVRTSMRVLKLTRNSMEINRRYTRNLLGQVF